MKLMNNFNIKIEQIISNEDGGATVVFELDEKTKNSLIESLNWEEWDDNKFQEFVIESLKYYQDKYSNDESYKNVKNPDFLWSKVSER